MNQLQRNKSMTSAYAHYANLLLADGMKWQVIADTLYRNGINYLYISGFIKQSDITLISDVLGKAGIKKDDGLHISGDSCRHWVRKFGSYNKKPPSEKYQGVDRRFKKARSPRAMTTQEFSTKHLMMRLI